LPNLRGSIRIERDDANSKDVSDEEWAFVAPYLVLMKEDAPQRQYGLREVFDGLRTRCGLARRGV
jgi:transposase